MATNDLSSKFGINDGTIYDKSTNTGFSKPEDFFAASGVNSFDNLKLDESYKPPTPASTKPITLDQLKPETPINVPIQKPDNTDLMSVISMNKTGERSLNDYLTLINSATPNKSEATNLENDITSLFDQLGYKATDQAESEKASNIPELKKQLSDIQGQIMQESATTDAGLIDLENRPQQIASVVGSKQQQLIRNQAAKVGLLNARAQALQGNISSALETINRAIDLKYSTKENQLNTKLQQLSFVKERLNSEETKRAKALELFLNDEKQKVADQKDRAKSLFTLAINQGVTKPFFNLGGTIVRTSDGKEYATPQEASKDGVDTKNWGNVENITLGATGSSSQWKQIGETIVTNEDGSQTKVPQYGFVNEKNETVLPFNSALSGNLTLTNGAKLGDPKGEIMGIPAYDTFSENPNLSRPIRNNNPGNIKVSEFTKKYSGVIGVEARSAKDGGNFLIFATPEDGLNAIKKLITNPKGGYAGLTADSAIKRYSHNSYGASVVGLVPKSDFQTQLEDPIVLDNVVKAIARIEGFDIDKMVTAETKQKPFYGLPKDVYDRGAKIADDFRQESVVKNFIETQNKKESVDAILESGVGGPGDLSLVYEFMKALDPNSVVRETEYETAAKSGNIFAGTLAKYNGYLKTNGGFLPDSVKNGFKSIIKTKFDVASKAYDNTYNEYARKIDRTIGKTGLGKEFITNYSNSGNYDDYIQSLKGGSSVVNSYLDSQLSLLPGVKVLQ